jgi:prepilin-type N-terminal cleavage/methylation domain-containing protein
MDLVRTTREAGYTAIEMMVVLALMGLLSAMSIPSMGMMLGHYRLSGDARGVSNVVAVAKTRAAAAFTTARLYVDLSTGRFHVETWRKTGTPGWVAEGHYGGLSVGNTFGFAGLPTPPPNTQAGIALSPPCRDDDGDAIDNTACVLFNSRGVPVDTSGVPTGAGGLYVTDGAAIYGVTIAASGLTRLWRAQSSATPVWVRQ